MAEARSAAHLANASVRTAQQRDGSWADLLAAVREHFGWIDGTAVLDYRESVADCRLTRRHFGDSIAEPGADAWEGRMFAESGDLRWVRRSDGRFDAWATWEGDGGVAANRREMRYYLLGESAGELRHGEVPMTEGRFPGKVFLYPAPEGGAPARQDRAFVVVHEYERTEAEVVASADATRAEDALNAPLRFAHRFVRLEHGRSSR